jgi:ketosteroid isomerase-like protein
MRKLLIGVAFGIVVLVLAACGNSTSPSAADQELQRKADLYEIEQIEKNFHHAQALQDIDRMMSLWAPNATLTAGPALTAAGIDEIREFWLASPVFDPANLWASDHPAYKLETTVNGDRGTLHFECHFVDMGTEEVVLVTAADLDVARINERWLITNLVGSTTSLTA